MKPLKSPRELTMQIKHLQEHHNLQVDDMAYAIEMLSNVNYYRLSAYGIGLKNPNDKEKFIDGVSLNTLFRLYNFDCILRNILMPTLENLEIQLRAKVAYRLAMTYGPDGFYDLKNFNVTTNKQGKNIHTRTIALFEKEVRKQQKLPFVFHHIKNYEGRFPIWVAVELFSFGMLSSFFSIMNFEDKKEVAKEFNTVPKYLQSWIFALLEARNRCAHYGRVYNMPLQHLPHLYSENRPYFSNRIFPLIITIKRMLGDSLTWNTFINKLIDLTNEYPEANLQCMGFPENWKEVLL